MLNEREHERKDAGTPAAKDADRTWRGAFRVLWSATVVSRFGDGLRKTAVPLLAASLTSSPFLLSLVSVVNYLPWLLFGLAGGAVADRVDRQTAMWVTDLLRGALGCVLAVLVATGHAGMGALMLVGFALSSLQTLFDSASTSMLPSVVPADELTVANGRLSVARTIAETLVGAAVAATLFGAAPSLPFVLDAVSFLAAAVLVLRLRLPPSSGTGADRRRASRSLRQEIGEGLAWLGRDAQVRTVCGTAWIASTGMGAYGSTLVLQLTRSMHTPVGLYGVVMAGAGVGGLIGGLVAARVTRALGTRRTLGASLLACGTGVALLAVCPDYRVATLLLAVVYCGFMVWNANETTVLQQRVPDDLRGRVFAANHTLNVMSLPVGALLGGVTAEHFSLAAPDLVGGALLLGGVLPIWRLTSLDSPADGVEPSAGPVEPGTAPPET
ncbi:MFS transporter [Streptomyces sp. NBC_00343]|uniref:MFS transporter n=1 Tax=Streptomyces sp. NBC_00343 TaxID=2975719 RepID=UPI002E2BF36A|nr:MFS transporter [Streptomyces sp. NBC_00343]